MTETPLFSLIVPVYNRAHFLEKLLKSTRGSSFQDFELIVVDDASSENLGSVAKKYKTIYIRLKENSGAGAARNAGAKVAKGKILVFIDSDAILFKNALSELAKSFKDPEVKAVIGVYDKKPANPSFFTHFKALRDHSYTLYEKDLNQPIGGFGGWISAIGKELFQDLGGFDESYRGAGMEDYEFAWRLIKRTKIISNPKVRIRHSFGGFWHTLRNFYKRSYLWTKLYFKYKRFFSSATNPKEALVAGLANLSTGLLVLSILTLSWKFCILFLTVFAARLYLGRVFLRFVAKERGILFALATLPISHTLYLAVYAGAARAFYEKITEKIF